MAPDWLDNVARIHSRICGVFVVLVCGPDRRLCTPTALSTEKRAAQTLLVGKTESETRERLELENEDEDRLKGKCWMNGLATGTRMVS